MGLWIPSRALEVWTADRLGRHSLQHDFPEGVEEELHDEMTASLVIGDGQWRKSTHLL
jgi:hypothetical protein